MGLDQERRWGMARILVVDDSESALRYLQQVLRDRSHVVFAASSGTRGLEILEQERIDMVVTDIYMPEPDGIELMRRARAMQLNVPFIAISARPSPLNMFIPARALGARMALQKPFPPERLVDAVEAVLDLSRGSPLPEGVEQRRDRGRNVGL